LGDAILPQPPNEFRTNSIANREQKEEKEDRFKPRRHRDIKLPNDQRRDQDPGHATERESGDLNPPNQKPDRNGKIDRELRMKSEGFEDKMHAGRER
jgi:hypothetical protein